MNKLKTAISLLVFAMWAGVFTSCGGPVTASDVDDKASLKAFVLAAKAHLEKDYETAVDDFRNKEEWKTGSIYLFGLYTSGINLFHVAQPTLEGQDLKLLADDNGVRPTEELIKVAQENANGGFVEYLWDNPAIPGDDDSEKVSYAVNFTKDGKTYVVGAGIYK